MQRSLKTTETKERLWGTGKNYGSGHGLLQGIYFPGWLKKLWEISISTTGLSTKTESLYSHSQITNLNME